MNTKGTRTYLTLRQAAWLLGMPQSSIHRLIRVGVLHPTRRRNRLVVPASEVARLMGGAR
jgi:predicted site-specific integrase-resolvase